MAKKKVSTQHRSGSFTDEADARALQTRLRRVEGQVRAVQGMIDQNRYCVDVLTQLAAAQQGLRAVSQEVIRSHLKHCVKDACCSEAADPEAIIEELLGVLKKYR